MNLNRVELIKGDITTIEAEAIVNAANNSLLGGGGVDGAIHSAAGPDLLSECRGLNGCATGSSKITRGYNLKAKYVIHTVGPVWYGGYRDEESLLASCYQTSLALAEEKKIKAVAFPGISTGAYGFPKDLAATIAINETKRFLNKNRYPEKVIFVTFSDSDYDIYRSMLDQ
ncbi:MAG TPA: O-acetyl-ADP-ribose deacetylase [Bacteroidales bacterium]|nr:O-acetyl-ADP-ribose deacetylase [Bacteroidales bacterium]HPT22085.1 O-acetyl-ADP-ribose deacetylase [Bacteroidales bacterium]